MARPVVAKATHPCPACGEQIIRGVSRVMKRYRYQDWVHNRPSCLNSTEKLGSSAEL